jgi:hypothetical protein
MLICDACPTQSIWQLSRYHLCSPNMFSNDLYQLLEGIGAMSAAEGKKASAQGSNYQENMTAPPLNEDDGIASDEGVDDQEATPKKADSVLSAIEKVSLLCSTLPCKSDDG